MDDPAEGDENPQERRRLGDMALLRHAMPTDTEAAGAQAGAINTLVRSGRGTVGLMMVAAGDAPCRAF